MVPSPITAENETDRSRKRDHTRFEGIVDPPLKAGECTNHQNTGSKTFGAERKYTGFLGDLADAFTLVLSFAEQRHDRIGGMGDNSTDHSSSVSGSERDSKLSALRVSFLRLREDFRVE